MNKLDGFNVVSVLREGGGSRPHVAKLQRNGEIRVVKNHNGCDPLFARCLGRLLTRREKRALIRLDGIANVPRLMGQPDVRALCTEWIDAISIKDAIQRDTDWNLFLHNLEKVLDDIHALGVAHCDLRGMSNILVGSGNSAFLIDFVSCFFSGPRWNILQRWAFKQFCAADRAALLKLKQRVAPERLNADEARQIAHTSFFNRFVRSVGRAIRSLSILLLTRRSTFPPGQ